jgi:hypothetical protein
MDQNQRPNKPTRRKEGGINENRDAGNEGQEGRKASRRTTETDDQKNVKN